MDIISKAGDKNILVFLPSFNSIKMFRRMLGYVYNTNKKNRASKLKYKEILISTKDTISSHQFDTSKYNIDAKDIIILSTNVLETGVTLPFLDIVIDTGYQNSVTFQYNINIKYIDTNSLISKSSAKQRYGRVG